MNTDRLREDFPLFQKKNPPIYLDSACMSLRPKQVIAAITDYYENYPACAGRSVHSLSQRVDEEVYAARKKVQRFINAKKEEEVIFLRNTTEGINLVARTFNFKKGDVILISDKEHNSNLLPWQVIAKKQGLIIDIIPSTAENTFSIETFKSVMQKHQGKVKLVALGHTSNLDGVSIPAKEIIQLAHKEGAKVLLDAAQSAPHHELNVKKLGADFVAFSGHKMLGPSGIGVLYGIREELEQLTHDNVGGETVHNSTYTDASWEGLPHKFEAGLQHYAGIIGLGTAVDYLKKVSLQKISRHETALNKQATETLENKPWFSVIGPIDPTKRGGIINFNIKGMHPHDIAGMLNASKQIMVRSGGHCVHSWFNKHKLKGSVRASCYLYTSEQEIEQLTDELQTLHRLK